MSVVQIQQSGDEWLRGLTHRMASGSLSVASATAEVEAAIATNSLDPHQLAILVVGATGYSAQLLDQLATACGLTVPECIAQLIAERERNHG